MGDLPALAAGTKVEALWDFAPTDDDELRLEEGDVITLTGMADGQWWEGELNDKTGWFPSNYVKIVESESEVYDYISTSGVNAAAAAEEGAESSEAEKKAAAGISIEKNRNWYKMYKNQKKYEPKTKDEPAAAPVAAPVISAPAPAPMEEQKSESRLISRVVMPVEMPRQKWSDDIDGAILGRLSDKEKKRQEVIFELLQTERDYVRDLDIIIEMFLNPMRQRKILPAKDVAMLFSNIESLLPVNQELLRDLEEKRETYYIIHNVGDVFIRVADYLKMYNMYCSNHPYSVGKLESIKTKQFRNFLQEQRVKPECRNLDLGSFLIKPVQRICKYPLLIREIMKFTEEGHADREDLEEAFKKIEMVVTIVNEASRQAEAAQKMLSLQNKFVDRIELIAPSRQMIREDNVVEMVDGKEKERRKLYLFTDILIFAKHPKNNNDKLVLIDNIPLDLLIINEADGLGIELVHTAHSKHIIRVADVVMKQNLLQDLREVAKEEADRKEQERMYATQDDGEDQEAFGYAETAADLEPVAEVDEEAMRKEQKKEDERRRKEDEKARKEDEKARKEEEKTRKKEEEAKAKAAGKTKAVDERRASSGSAPVSSVRGSVDESAAKSSAAPSPTPSQVTLSPPAQPSTTNPSRRSASSMSSSTPTEKPNELDEFQNKMKNLRKTQLYEEPQARSSKSPAPSTASQDPESTLAAYKAGLRQSRAVEEPAVARNNTSEAVPEFAKVKLRATRVYSEADLTQAKTEPLPSSPPVKRSASQPDVRQEADKPAKKKKGFFSAFFGLFRRKRPIDENGASSAASTPTTTAASSAKTSAVSTPVQSPSVSHQQSPPSRPTASPANSGGASRTASGSNQPSHSASSSASGGKPNQRGSIAAQSGPLVTIQRAAVRDHRKLDTKQGTYVYFVEVVRDDNNGYVIEKSYDDFYAFHSSLVFQFPEEAGSRGKRRILPDLPIQSAFVTESMAEQRQRELDRYLKALLRLPEKISKSTFMSMFLKPDARTVIAPARPLAPKQPNAGNNSAPAGPSRPAPSVPSSSSQPAPARAGPGPSPLSKSSTPPSANAAASKTTGSGTSSNRSSANVSVNTSAPVNRAATPSRSAPAPPAASASVPLTEPMKGPSVAAVRASYVNSSGGSSNNTPPPRPTSNAPKRWQPTSDASYRYKELPPKPEAPARPSGPRSPR